MSEVDLTVLAFRAKANDEKTPTPMQEINEVLKTCKFGRFHVKVLCSSFFGVLTAVLISNTIPYVLPIAECDLNMNLLQKGILNAMPFFGMLVSSILAGFLTDTFGRKIFLLIGYGGITVFNLVSAMSQTYVMLITSKFFEGLLFAAAFNPTMTYTSECCYSNIRDRMMLCQSSFQTFGQFLLAFLSWGLLTQDWRYNFFDGAIVINSWNIYLLVVTVCPLSACILYGLLPESPKFLISQHRYEEARAILIRIYVSNTGKPRDTFPYKDLWKDKEKRIKDETRERNVESTLKHNLVIGLHNVKPLFKKPLLPYLALFCLMNFLIMFLYNTIRLWFPQLSTIVEHYSNNEETNQDLCVMLDSYTHDLRMRNAVNSTIQEICVPTKSGAETYINSIILGLACLLPYIISGLLVNKVGKKSILMVAGVITIGATLGLRWSRSKTEVVALFAATMAASQAMMSLLQATTVEVFPTTTRTLAISMTMTSGRLGTLVGNITFPILLNMGCAVPLFTMAGVMISVTSMTIFLPKKK